MGLEEFRSDVETAYTDLADHPGLDAETRTELAVLVAALDPADTDELVRRAVHLLFQQTVDTGRLDLHLRRRHDLTYDEYLSGMTYDEMDPGTSAPEPDDDRRYRF